MSRVEAKRLANRRWYHRKRGRGLCVIACGRSARPGKATCASCARQQSLRRNDYQRRHGARPRYGDGRGYRPRKGSAVVALVEGVERIIDTITRRCLRCGVEFASVGPQNRRCERCNARVAAMHVDHDWLETA